MAEDYFDPTLNMAPSGSPEEQEQDYFDPTVPSGTDVRGVSGGSPFKTSFTRSLDIANRGTGEGFADYSTLVKAGFVDDPATRIAIFAKDMFPDEPLEQSMQRFGATADGEILYTTDDGQTLNLATPEGVSLREISADIIGKAPTIGGATVGAIGGAVGGAGYGAAPGAAMGAGFGEGIRQHIASDYFGQPFDPEEMRQKMLMEGAFAGGGELLGAGVAKYLNRFRARDLGRMDVQDVAALQRKADAFDIQLTPAELTNLRSLKGQQSALMTMPDSADIIEDFLVNTRIPQVRKAVYGYLDEVSPEPTPMLGSEKAVSAAKNIPKRITKQAQDAAQPFYERAYASGATVQVDDLLRNMDDIIDETSGGVRNRVSRLKSQIKQKSKDGSLTIKEVDSIKKDVIDPVLDAKGDRTPDKRTRMFYQRVKNELTGLADEASPDYAKAREVYGEVIEPLNEVKESAIGKLAELEGDASQRAAKILFSKNTSSPEAVRKARRILTEEDPEAWNAVVRSYLQDTFESIPDSAVGAPLNLGGRLRKQVFGTESQKKMMKEALTDKQYKTFEELMDVLEATGRAMKGESITATRQVQLSDMADEAAGPIMSKATNIVGGPSAWREWFRSARLGQYSEELANVITDPNSMKMLRQLKQLPPNSELRLRMLGAILGVSTPVTLEDE